LQHLINNFRADVPQLEVLVDRVKAESLHVSVGDVFDTLSAYVGSSYVNQFNKFGRTFQVYAQADAKFRLLPEDIANLKVRSQDGQMVPLGTLVETRQTTGPALITLYNLYPAATIIGAPAPGFSSGEAMSLMEQIGAKALPRGAAYEWTALSYQEKSVGGQIYTVFGLGMLLVYLCLAAQYESWIAPLAVILAVPLSLAGPAIALGALGLANNLYTQIGLVLLIALAAKNAILIVEVARERRLREQMPIIQAAVSASETRFRPIVMTSLAFILGVVPLVIATGAGAAARVSLGLSVLTGMLASTCLAVLFVPSFFVVFQRIEERVKRRPKPRPVAGTVEP
jgi:hydrophobic/amphiphilic exporter-1 (mainly G- bacteria), HAE1 family